MRQFFILLFLVMFTVFSGVAQDAGHSGETSTHEHTSKEAQAGDHLDVEAGEASDSHAHTDDHSEHPESCCGIDSHEDPRDFDPAATALHHIADANAWHLGGDLYIPLPCFLYAPGQGWSFFLSSKFDMHHGTGSKAIDRYIINHGIVMRIADDSFPMGEIPLDCIGSDHEGHVKVNYGNQCYDAHDRSVLDGGLVGGGLTSYYDFSITKNVLTMIIAFFLLGWIFTSAARAYKTFDKEHPQGFWQRILEPVFIFMRDEVCIPVIGPKYEKYMPFIMSLFFFILGLNLVGQIPFIGNPNVTGNIAFTAILAIFTFIITSVNGNKHYWQHVLWMPGVPAAVKIILTPIEILGLFLKPLTLLVRLFANITAGHIIILSFVGLIFIFGNIGHYEWGIGYGGGNIIGLIMAVFLTLFMSAIELLVAFLQAFIFAILSASYIGAAIVDDHH